MVLCVQDFGVIFSSVINFIPPACRAAVSFNFPKPVVGLQKQLLTRYKSFSGQYLSTIKCRKMKFDRDIG